jgi:glycosyltransferase involved in cell wall biosynthesis
MPIIPSVCIMIPTYNQAEYIMMAVETALQQDYPNLQVLVADDCSTDNTEALLQPYAAAGKIIYRKNPHNTGRAANYKKCLYEYAGADWVLNLDGDDYFTNASYISEAMDAITKAGADDVLFYQGVNIYKTATGEKLYKTGVQGQVVVTGSNYFFNYFRRNHFSHMSALYNRQSAISSGFYDKKAISSDIYSFMRCALNNPAKKIILTSNVSGVWLQHGENASSNVRLKDHWQNWQLYQQLYKTALQKGYKKAGCIRWWLAACAGCLRMYFAAVWKRLKN